MAAPRVKITADSGNYLSDDVFETDAQVVQQLVAQSIATEVTPGVALNLEDTPAECYWDRFDRKKGWPTWP